MENNKKERKQKTTKAVVRTISFGFLLMLIGFGAGTSKDLSDMLQQEEQRSTAGNEREEMQRQLQDYSVVLDSILESTINSPSIATLRSDVKNQMPRLEAVASNFPALQSIKIVDEKALLYLVDKIECCAKKCDLVCFELAVSSFNAAKPGRVEPIDISYTMNGNGYNREDYRTVIRAHNQKLVTMNRELVDYTNAVVNLEEDVKACILSK